MSWLGGSLLSLTGQLSNLTKDLLTEGTEEVSDPATELRLAQEKLKELDIVCVSQKIEIDRLKSMVQEAEEIAEGSELQINKISKEYRTLLAEKQEDVKSLKHEIQELKGTSTFVNQHLQPAFLQLDSDNGFENVSYGGDEHDFGDTVAMQHDINHLRGELQRLQTECQHWKNLAQQPNDTERDSNSVLLKQIQELQQELDQEKDQRQHELSSLQDAHSRKISQMHKKHKEEVAELQTKIRELDWGLDGWETQMQSDDSSLKVTISSLKEEITDLKKERETHLEKISALNEALEEQKSELAVSQTNSIHLKNELKVAKEEIARLQADHEQVGRELFDTKQKLLHQLDANHQKELTETVQSLEFSDEALKKETNEIVQSLDDRKTQEITADKQISTQRSSSQHLEADMEPFELLHTTLKDDKEILEELGQPLKEKENLSSVVAKKYFVTGGKLTTNPSLPDLVEAQNDEKFDDLIQDVIELDRKVVLLTEANAKLEQERDTLAKKKAHLEHELKILKDKLSRMEMTQHNIHKPEEDKDTSLNVLLKAKENELQCIMSEKEDLEKNLADIPELMQQLQQKEDKVENLLKSQKRLSSRREVERLEREVEDLEKKLSAKNEELAQLSLEKDEMVISLEELDNQHQQALSHLIQKKDELVKANDDLKKKLTQSEKERQWIKTKFEKELVNQTSESSTSNELNHQIAELNNEIAELQEKCNILQHTISKQDSDIKSKDGTIKELNSKLALSAEALNDLHMDKQELHVQITKLKEENKNKTEKLKCTREENSKLKYSLGAYQSSENNGETLFNSYELQDRENQLEHLSSKLETTEKQLKIKKEECKMLKNDMQSLEDKLQHMTNENEIKEQEITELSSSLAEKVKKTTELEAQLAEASEDCKRLQNESTKKHEECESFSRQLHAIENELHSIKLEQAEKFELNKSASSMVDRLNNELTYLQQKFDSKVTEFEFVKNELERVKDLLEDATDKLHTKCEECNDLIEQLDGCKDELAMMNDKNEDKFNAELLSATGELVLVKEELAYKNEELERLNQGRSNILHMKDEKIDSLKLENDQLEQDIDLLKSELQKSNEKIVEVEDKLKAEYSLSFKELREHNENLSMENNHLNITLTALEQKFADHVKKHDFFVENLTSSQNTAITDVQYNELLESMHQKDLCLSEQDSKIKNLLEQLQIFQKDMDISKQECDSLKNMCLTKEQVLSTSDSKLEILKNEMNLLSEAAKQNKIFLEKFANENATLQDEIRKTKFENECLNSRIRELETHIESCKEREDMKNTSIAEYLKEQELLRENIAQLELQMQKQKKIILDQETGITDINQRRTESLHELETSAEKVKSLKSVIEVLKQSLIQKDSHISSLNRKLTRAISFIDKDKAKHLENDFDALPNYNLPTLEYQQNQNTELHFVENKIDVQTSTHLGSALSNGNADIQHSEHEHNVIEEIDRLQRQLNEKDNVISELQRNNSSLLKMLENKSKNLGDNSLMVIHKLENEVKSLQKEREQILDILNEKSRENSTMKAEVQRLINTVTAEKAAIEKLQRDYNELQSRPPEKNGAHVDDMQKEVVKNLSRIIRDKDLEIEALTQKNQTLLSVLQESSNEGTQINSVLLEKDSLIKQLTTLKEEREQLIIYLNQKHQESVNYHAEVQRLSAFINTENEMNQRIKLDYESLVPQFENKKQALLNLQNELINFKQKYKELEVKYGQLIQQSGSSGTVDKAFYDAKLQEIDKIQDRYRELMQNVQEKESIIHNLHQQISDTETNLRTTDSERSSYKKQVDNFMFQLHGLQMENHDLKVEIVQLKQQIYELSSENQILNETNNKLTLQNQDHNFQVTSLQDKVKSLTAVMNEQQGEKGQLEHVISENEKTHKHLQQLTQERDQALLKSKQKQEENVHLLKDIQSLKEKESKQTRELLRLKEHLIQIEEGYTAEALEAEKREKELRTRLANAEERALSSSSTVESVSQQSSQKLDSLHQQLYFVSQQRDQAYLQISSLQEQNQMCNSSISNLQMVLEEFQQEKDRMVAEETKKYEKENKSLKERIIKLLEDLKYTKNQLDEASSGLEAAARLSEQLDRKEETIDALRQEVESRENTLKVVEDELHKLKSRNDDRVDKLVIKNLFLGYFTTPQNKRHEVLHAIGGVLLFTSDDFEKIEGSNKGSGWMPGFLKFSGVQTTSPSTTPVKRSPGGGEYIGRKADNTFSEMFVKFLERESSPPPPTVRLPAEQMVRDVQKQKEAQKPVFNPFTAARHVAASHQTGSPTLGTRDNAHHLLIGSAVSVSQTLPTFAAPVETSRMPPGSGRNTPAMTMSGAILKDVLNK